VRQIARYLLTAAVTALTTDAALAQFPPGGGGGPPSFGGDRGGRSFGRGGMDPDSSFDRLQQSYGGTGDVIDYARIPPERREMSNRFLQMAGEPPMPTSGTISRDQYRADFSKRMEKMQAQFGNRGGGGPPGMTPPGGAPMTMSVTVGSTGAPPTPIPGAPQMSDDMYRSMMQRSDTDRDGRISFDEAQRSGTLREAFASYDKNGDKFLDLEEFKGYMNDRMSGRLNGFDRGDRSRGGPPDMAMAAPPGGPPPGYSPPSGDDRRSSRDSRPSDESDQRQVVYRYGKLPTKDLPSWFTKLDEDHDGQIGLYEWRKGGESYPISGFTPMDLNGDGFITAEEYLLYRKLKDENDKLASAENGDAPRSSGSNPFGGSSSSSSRSSERSSSDRSERSKPSKDEKKEERRPSGGKNPFTNR
jgi:hypothetical protein